VDKLKKKTVEEKKIFEKIMQYLFFGKEAILNQLKMKNLS
jgi:hypothetical protein